MLSVTDAAFIPYGRVLDLNVEEFVKAINKRPPVKADTVVYEPSVKEFESLPLFEELQKKVFGELQIEFGHCSGFNDSLNAVEYHRTSEIDIAATDLILMLGKQQDIDYENFTYDTSKIEIFFVPAGTAVELYATTLHYAPCSVDGKEFRCGVVLPASTNLNCSASSNEIGENKLLFAVNKWLIAHKESGLDKLGAWIGLEGKNLKI